MDAPKITLRKVEKHRERRKAGVAWAANPGASSGLPLFRAGLSPFGAGFGASGGGFSGVLASLAQFSAVRALALFATMGGALGGGWMYGKAMLDSASQTGSAAGAIKMASGSSRERNARSAAERAAASARNSLAMITMDGMTPEQRAAKAAADAEAKRIADEEAAKKAAEAADAQSLAEQTAANAATAAESAGADAAANAGSGDGSGFNSGKLLGSAQSALGSKYGAITFGATGGSGGGSGGGSATLGGGFSRPLGGGAGGGSRASRSTGGRGTRLGAVGGKNGRLSASRSAAKPTVTRGVSGSSGSRPQYALGELRGAGRTSVSAVNAGNNEGASRGSGGSFDNNRGGGSVSGGAGSGGGSGGGGTDGGTDTGTGTGTGEGTGTNTGICQINCSGGPLEPGDDDDTEPGDKKCGAKQILNVYGSCVDIEVQEGVAKKSSWEPLVDLAKKMLMVIAGLGLAIFVLEKIPWPWGKIAAQVLRRIMGVLAVFVAALGAAVMAMGQLLQGGILAAIGTIVAIVSLMPDTKTAAKSDTIIKQGLQKTNAPTIIKQNLLYKIPPEAVRAGTSFA